MITHKSISSLRPFICWEYFYYAWGIQQQPEEQTRLRQEAEHMLDTWEGHVTIGIVAEEHVASGDGDNIVLHHQPTCPCATCQSLPLRHPSTTIIPCLRQQTGKPPYLCLSDFVNPKGDRVTLFATSCKPPQTDDPYQQMLTQTLADRLAEAASASLEKEGEGGLGFAVGYPSLPDQSIIFDIDKILGIRRIGISLTENGMMTPHASVCGILIHHPKAHYFDIGAISNEQLEDYAQRRGKSRAEIAKYFRQ